MAKSTRSRRPRKVTKPRPDFPLFPHASGRWAKKVRGSLCYFGKTADDPKGQAALALWLDQKDDLLAGRKPRAKNGGVTLADMVNTYLADADDRRAAGELSPLSFRDYQWTGERMVEHFGRTVDPTQIRPTEFAAFRTAMAARYSPSRLGKTITVCRMMFRWAYESEDHRDVAAIRAGIPGRNETCDTTCQGRIGRQGVRRRRTADASGRAPEPLNAMILLGVNGGFGNMDIAKLPLSAVDLDGGWIDFPRPKTGIPRRVPLWPETVEALRTVIENRPKPSPTNWPTACSSRRVGESGSSFTTTADDTTGSRFGSAKLTRDTETYQQGRSFYGCDTPPKPSAAAHGIKSHSTSSWGTPTPAWPRTIGTASTTTDSSASPITSGTWLFDDDKDDARGSRIAGSRDAEGKPRLAGCGMTATIGTRGIGSPEQPTSYRPSRVLCQAAAAPFRSRRTGA